MNITNILQMLDCCNDIETQNKGIKLAENITDINIFIQPMYPLYNKNVWENCAVILDKRSDEELKPYLKQLLEWLQDLNWPGTFIIIDRLKRFNGELLFPFYTAAINETLKRSVDDQEWLDNLSVLIENKELSNELSRDLYNSLEKIYNDFWN